MDIRVVVNGGGGPTNSTVGGGFSPATIIVAWTTTLAVPVWEIVSSEPGAAQPCGPKQI